MSGEQEFSRPGPQRERQDLMAAEAKGALATTGPAERQGDMLDPGTAAVARDHGGLVSRFGPQPVIDRQCQERDGISLRPVMRELEERQ